VHILDVLPHTVTIVCTFWICCYIPLQ